jgi:hypothetical protein
MRRPWPTGGCGAMAKREPLIIVVTTKSEQQKEKEM